MIAIKTGMNENIRVLDVESAAVQKACNFFNNRMLARSPTGNGNASRAGYKPINGVIEGSYTHWVEDRRNCPGAKGVDYRFKLTSDLALLYEHIYFWDDAIKRDVLHGVVCTLLFLENFDPNKMDVVWLGNVVCGYKFDSTGFRLPEGFPHIDDLFPTGTLDASAIADFCELANLFDAVEPFALSSKARVYTYASDLKLTLIKPPHLLASGLVRIDFHPYFSAILNAPYFKGFELRKGVEDELLPTRVDGGWLCVRKNNAIDTQKGDAVN